MLSGRFGVVKGLRILGFQGFGFRVQGLGFRNQGLRILSIEGWVQA